MSDEIEKQTWMAEFTKWLSAKGPGAMAFVGLLTAATGWLNAEAAKTRADDVREETEQVESSARDFETAIAEARAQDEAALNEVLDRCYENDRLLRYYAHSIESRLTTLVANALDRELAYTPAEFPSPADVRHATIEEKLEELYSDDEVRELVRLIELSRQFDEEEE
jgi:hypothetical protein